ncbi:hypothetical protein GCM10009587_00930 [Microbacterium maritypicum]
MPGGSERTVAELLCLFAPETVRTSVEVAKLPLAAEAPTMDTHFHHSKAETPVKGERGKWTSICGF